MKKICMLTFALITGLVLFAQEQQPVLRTARAVTTRFGIKAGINLATYNVNDFPANNSLNTNMKTSFHVGGLVNIPLSTNFRLQPELVYSGQGSKMSQRVSSTGSGSKTYNYEEDMHYMNLPIMVQYQDAGGFYAETGPQFGYMIDSKTEGTTYISTTDLTNMDPFRDNFDFSWGVGLGYLSRVGLGVGARYNFGLRNIVKGTATNEGELKHKIIQIGLTYQFGAHK